jgi:hypothetical protein
MGSTVSRPDSEFSAAVALSATNVTVKAACSTTAACVKLAPGHWKVSLRGADATCDVYLSFGAADTVTVAEPSDTADNGDATGVAAGVTSFRGDEVERIVVTSGTQFVAFILSAGGTTNKIKFVKVA